MQYKQRHISKSEFILVQKLHTFFNSNFKSCFMDISHTLSRQESPTLQNNTEMGM